MKIDALRIKVKDIFEGYSNKGENGVVAYGGKLNIRPKYQREFIYGLDKQRSVIKTILRGYPLNTMYWVKNRRGEYELLDGQQRTMSICEFLNGSFTVNEAFGGLRSFDKEKDCETAIGKKILDYELTIYICKEGSADERLDWFETINIAGEPLNKQELKNAHFTGDWLADAKAYFSRKDENYNEAIKKLWYDNKSSHKIADMNGEKANRQLILELALKWVAIRDNCTIQEYMEKHEKDADASDLKSYFTEVCEWVKTTFGSANYREEMKSVEWGKLYNKYKDNAYDVDELKSCISELMANEEVTDKKGVYEYILSGRDEDYARKLSKRAFSDRDKRTAYEKQDGKCPICGEHHEFKEMEGDHIKPWWIGGTTTLNNLQMLCKKCNGRKSGKTIKTE